MKWDCQLFDEVADDPREEFARHLRETMASGKELQEAMAIVRERHPKLAAQVAEVYSRPADRR
jgi:hypothetical protein